MGKIQWHDLDSCIEFAKNPNTKQQTLNKFSEHMHELVRMGIAVNPNMPKRMFNTLSKDRSWAVRCALASREDVPLNILKVLAYDDERIVRLHVARNPKTSADILETLRYDSWHYVREAIAKRKNACMHTLSKPEYIDKYKSAPLATKNKKINKDELKNDLNKLAEYEKRFKKSMIALMLAFVLVVSVVQIFANIILNYFKM